MSLFLNLTFDHKIASISSGSHNLIQNWETLKYKMKVITVLEKKKFQSYFSIIHSLSSYTLLNLLLLIIIGVLKWFQYFKSQEENANASALRLHRPIKIPYFFCFVYYYLSSLRVTPDVHAN